MITYSKAAELVLQGWDKYQLRSPSCKYKKEEKSKIEEILRVEERVWNVYMRTGHFSVKRFEFDLLKPFPYDNTRKVQRLALILLKSGWTPFHHSTKTREYYKNIHYIENYRNTK